MFLMCNTFSFFIIIIVFLCPLLRRITYTWGPDEDERCPLQILEKASFKWLPLLLVPEKIKPVLSAPFVPVAEMLQGVWGEFSVISAEMCLVNGFGASSSLIIDVFFQWMVFAVVRETELCVRSVSHYTC